MRFPWIAIAASVCSFAGQAEPPPRNPIVRVVTVGQAGLGGKGQELFEDTLERLERAASYRPDIACLPELALRDIEEPALGPVRERLAKWARRNSSYLIYGIRARDNGKTYNSAILLGREGNVAGEFDKMYPTESELRDGISPGDAEPPVFETDFGLIGIQICFDVNWWENWKRLKKKGAKIIFFPAAYPAATRIGMLALMNEIYIVSSTQDRPSRIYDITGRVLASSGRFEPWAAAALPLGKRLFEIDYHTRKAREIQKKYGAKVRVTWYHDDDWFTLASLAPELTVADLITEFGLTPLDEYRQRATRAVERAQQEK
ncbi:MAG: carbon-nitrogen hydrolase family protein [bacterium]|nr:carbon-nitrogen hydrolase family protein [bacterium]